MTVRLKLPFASNLPLVDTVGGALSWISISFFKSINDLDEFSSSVATLFVISGEEKEESLSSGELYRSLSVNASSSSYSLHLHALVVKEF